ncbi:unnamed protein product [Schistosoma spindalis]|nr:unnamed protein product [Schistosoma spindale]
MSPAQMMHCGGYPVNQDQIQSSYFGHDHNSFNSSLNIGPNQDTKQSSISTFPASNSEPELGVKSEEPTDFPVNSSISENNKTNNQNIVNSSPTYSCKPELLVNSVDNTLKGAGSSKTDNTILPKTGKVSHSAHRPKLPQQAITSSRSVQKVHSKSRPKKPHQEVSTETSSKNLQQFDPFTHWNQMMLQYYSQFHPAYQMAQPLVLPQQPTSHLSINKSSKTHASHSLNPTIKHGPEGFQIPPANQIGSFDYANYYYQYYAAAAQLWSGGYPYQFFGTCIPETPRFYNTPHVKAWIGCPGVIVQVLPSRPRNGEFARVEIINLFELVNEAVADATRRASDNTTRTCNPEFSQQQQQQPSEQNAIFNMTDSGMQTPSRLSSIDAGGAEDDGEEIRACVMATACWNRAEHQFYPGPLNRVGTLKTDVLVFLHEKLTEIQDRLPIDWGSAGLLLMFLETLVKNNGNLQTSDLVNLLLEGHKPTTDSFRSGSYGYSSSYLGVQVPVQYTGTLNNYNQLGEYVNESLASLPGSQVTSGRESPESHFEINYGSSLLQHNKAASETGRMSSVQNIIRRMGGVQLGGRGLHSQESEGKLLDRFRELLMHGLPIKALEHACRSKLWGHAFTLAHRMGPSTFAKVMDRFLNNDVSISDPILTLYQLTAGEMPQSVNTAAYGRGIDNGDWRPHLAMILAGHSSQSDLSLLALERLGDGLLSRKHIYAAHLCYLLMNSLKNLDDKQKEFRLPGKIWLIGVPPTYITSGGDVVNNTSDGFQEDNITSNHTLSPLFATSEAIQLTEIYEYSIQLANRNFHLRQLMPFRLVYAIRLLDAGFIEKAYRYLTAIGNEILMELDETTHQLKLQSIYNDNNTNTNTYVDPLLYSLISNCLRLAEPLQYHPEIESFDLLQSSTNNQNIEDYGFGFQFKNSSYSMPVQNKNWIERLNQIFNQMNQKINHPRYKSSIEKSKSNPSSDVHFTNEPMNTEYSDHNDSNDHHHRHQSSQPPQQQQQQQQHQQRQYHQFNKESNYKPSAEYRSNVQTHDSSSFLTTNNRDQRKVNVFNSNRNDNNYIPHEINNNNNNNNNNSNDPKIISNYSSIKNNKNDQFVDPIQKMNLSNQSSIHQRQLFNHESFNQQSPSSLSSVPPHEYSYQSEPYHQFSSNTTSNLIQHNDNIQHNYSMNSPIQLSNYPSSLQSNQPINSMLQSPLTVSTSSTSSSVTTTLNEMNNSIFMPINHQTDSQLMINNDNNSMNYSTLSNQQPFDYFANIQSIQSRSRTVSGNSENNPVNMMNSTTVDQLDPSSNNSRNLLSTKYENSFTNEHHIQQSQQQSISNLSQMNYLPQPSRHPSSMINDNFKDYNHTLNTATSTTTNTTNINNDDNNSSSERFTQDKSSDLNNIDKNEQQSKDGWLSGWFGRLKKNGPKNVHLPDDSKPS